MKDETLHIDWDKLFSPPPIIDDNSMRIGELYLYIRERGKEVRKSIKNITRQEMARV